MKRGRAREHFIRIDSLNMEPFFIRYESTSVTQCAQVEERRGTVNSCW